MKTYEKKYLKQKKKARAFYKFLKNPVSQRNMQIIYEIQVDSIINGVIIDEFDTTENKNFPKFESSKNHKKSIVKPMEL